MQDKLANNLYATELLPAYQSKTGFCVFVREHFKVEITPDQVRNIFNVNRKDETVTEIILDSPDTKNMIYSQRRKLRDLRKVMIPRGPHETQECTCHGWPEEVWETATSP